MQVEIYYQNIKYVKVLLHKYLTIKVYSMNFNSTHLLYEWWSEISIYNSNSKMIKFSVFIMRCMVFTSVLKKRRKIIVHIEEFNKQEFAFSITSTTINDNNTKLWIMNDTHFNRTITIKLSWLQLLFLIKNVIKSC